MPVSYFDTRSSKEIIKQETWWRKTRATRIPSLGNYSIMKFPLLEQIGNHVGDEFRGYKNGIFSGLCLTFSINEILLSIWKSTDYETLVLYVLTFSHRKLFSCCNYLVNVAVAIYDNVMRKCSKTCNRFLTLLPKKKYLEKLHSILASPLF